MTFIGWQLSWYQWLAILLVLLACSLDIFYLLASLFKHLPVIARCCQPAKPKQNSFKPAIWNLIQTPLSQLHWLTVVVSQSDRGMTKGALSPCLLLGSPLKEWKTTSECQLRSFQNTFSTFKILPGGYKNVLFTKHIADSFAPVNTAKALAAAVLDKRVKKCDICAPFLFCYNPHCWHRRSIWHFLIN